MTKTQTKKFVLILLVRKEQLLLNLYFNEGCHFDKKISEGVHVNNVAVFDIEKRRRKKNDVVVGVNGGRYCHYYDDGGCGDDLLFLKKAGTRIFIIYFDFVFLLLLE